MKENLEYAINLIEKTTNHQNLEVTKIVVGLYRHKLSLDSDSEEDIREEEDTLIRLLTEKECQLSNPATVTYRPLTINERFFGERFQPKNPMQYLLKLLEKYENKINGGCINVTFQIDGSGCIQDWDSHIFTFATHDELINFLEAK